jgi:hypothetical protein
MTKEPLLSHRGLGALHARKLFIRSKEEAEMQKRSLLVVLGLALFVAVSSCAESEPQTVEVTQLVPETVEVTREVTRMVPETVEVTRLVERVVTATPVPATPTPEPPDQGQAVAANYLGKQESGGIEIELVRVLFGDKEYVEEETGSDFGSDFEQVDTLGEFVLRITNSTDKAVTVYPDQGTVVIGDEQIDLDQWWHRIGNMEDVSGDLQPGVTRVGGFWFGVRRSDWDEIGKVLFLIDAPFDQDYDDLGSGFRFEIDISGMGFQPFPDDLR